ncbi:MAG: uroporphyrinogen decarboxylase family protein [Clostridiales bacterium]|nr:uroporphyrinogen decarboxylase family protein [Clostridiales bacterium]
MTSKERVLTTLEGCIPDRVPWGEFAVDFDTVEKIIGHKTFFRAKARSRIAFWEGRHEEVAQSYLEGHIELHRRLELDIVTFPMATWEIPPETDDRPPRKIDGTTWEDKYGRVFKYSPLTEDITCVKDPVEEARRYSLEEFKKEPPRPELDPRSFEILDAVIKEFKWEKFICGPSGNIPGIVFLGGLEKGSLAILQSPELVRAATNYLVSEQNLADEVLVHPEADAVLVSHDFGHKTGPFLNPDMFKDLFFEANRVRVKNLKDKHGKKVFLHSCGNVNSYFDFFIAIGFDAFQSIQASADMDISAIKKKYGEKITLWGGVSLENLISGTAEDVRRDVRRAMACAKPGGRFILGTSHSVAVGSRYENFMAMLDEYHKLAAY